MSIQPHQLIDHHTYAPAKRCIYCGETKQKLSKEHVIPLALNGVWILPQASCPDCAKITSRIEGICTGEHAGMFTGFRRRLKLRSRRGQKSEITTDVMSNDGSIQQQTFPANEFPAAVFGMKLPRAGILLGHEPSNNVEAEIIVGYNSNSKVKVAADEKLKIGTFYVKEFVQMIAKIGYAFASAELPTATLFPELADVVLAKSGKLPHYVGGGDLDQHDAKKMNYVHSLRMQTWQVRSSIFSVVVIHLFGQFDLPRYHVVVAQNPENKDISAV